MSFAVDANDYDRFMGKFSVPLASAFADFASVDAGLVLRGNGLRALDVGCGPGALTSELIRRLGPAAVSAIDPSTSFVAAMGQRHPGIDVRQGVAERLPFDANEFDVVLAQLVVHFMTDPVAGLLDMARVARADGTVAACVWDHEGGGGPLSVFWDAVNELDPDVHDESQLAGARQGHLAQLFREAGLRDVEDGVLTVCVEHQTFDDWWDPYTLGVGPAGAYVARLDDDRRVQLRERCRELLPAPPFEVTARAWAARGRA